ncbi:hypothetical protein DXC40_11825 [Anaerotruncus colihominis]|uniref:Uncharacterized protein n=1 Tax=Anaerotruncus colihominis TaxID=169435 RepID=A0A3E3IIN3_9FIRM|nr:hypothetical protein DXC40_11825 [Anaerotruncus colihominis]
MSAKRRGKIGHQGGSGLRPRIAPAIKGKMTALRLFYHMDRLHAMNKLYTFVPMLYGNKIQQARQGAGGETVLCGGQNRTRGVYSC